MYSFILLLLSGPALRQFPMSPTNRNSGRSGLRGLYYPCLSRDHVFADSSRGYTLFSTEKSDMSKTRRFATRNCQSAKEVEDPPPRHASRCAVSSATG